MYWEWESEFTTEAVLDRAHLLAGSGCATRDSYAGQLARRLFHTLHHRALVRSFWARLTGRPHQMLELADVVTTSTVEARHDAGIRTVPIDRIRGTEGPCEDFDAQFRPLRLRVRERWLGIAAAQCLGVPLEPVRLVQIGDSYFVQDGRHRVSVARALDQKDIDAHVTVWQVGQPLAADRAVPSEGKAGRARSTQRIGMPLGVGR